MLRRREAPAFDKSPPVVPMWPLTEADTSRSSLVQITTYGNKRGARARYFYRKIWVRVRLSSFAWY